MKARKLHRIFCALCSGCLASFVFRYVVGVVVILEIPMDVDAVSEMCVCVCACGLRWNGNTVNCSNDFRFKMEEFFMQKIYAR